MYTHLLNWNTKAEWTQKWTFERQWNARDVIPENIRGGGGMGDVDAQNCKILRMKSGEDEECLIVIEINITTPNVPGLRWIRIGTPIVN